MLSSFVAARACLAGQVRDFVTNRHKSCRLGIDKDLALRLCLSFHPFIPSPYPLKYVSDFLLHEALFDAG